METNIVIDERLVMEAMALTGLSSMRKAVEEALRRLIRAEQSHRALVGMPHLSESPDSTE